jgi:excisionase family DNA binding protein
VSVDVELLTVSEVAEVLRISKAEVYVLVAGGHIRKAALPYRKTLILRSELERLVGVTS